MFLFFFSVDVDHRELHVLPHSFPTRRSSDRVRRLPPIAARSGRATPPPRRAGGTIGPGIHRVRSRSGRAEPPPRCMAPHAAKRSPSASAPLPSRSEEHTSELQSLMRISYAVFCLKKKKKTKQQIHKIK